MWVEVETAWSGCVVVMCEEDGKGWLEVEVERNMRGRGKGKRAEVLGEMIMCVVGWRRRMRGEEVEYEEGEDENKRPNGQRKRKSNT